MKLLVIDAQGGGLGRQLVTMVKRAMPQLTVIAVGTNATATGAMLKAGADQAATGENAVIVAARRADIIAGPIGIVIADAMLALLDPPKEGDAPDLKDKAAETLKNSAGLYDKWLEKYWAK